MSKLGAKDSASSSHASISSQSSEASSSSYSRSRKGPGSSKTSRQEDSDASSFEDESSGSDSEECEDEYGPGKAIMKYTTHFSHFFPARWLLSSSRWRQIERSLLGGREAWLGPFLYCLVGQGFKVSRVILTDMIYLFF